MNWTRIPADVPNDDDRRRLMAILADAGLEIRMVKTKEGTRIKRYVEYRQAKAEEVTAS